MNRGPSSELVQAMYAYYQQSYSLAEVGECFHYSDMSVWYIFKRHGLPMRKGRAGFMMKFEAESRRMIADHETGMLVVDLAVKYGYSPETIRRRLRRYGVNRAA